MLPFLLGRRGLGRGGLLPYVTQPLNQWGWGEGYTLLTLRRSTAFATLWPPFCLPPAVGPSAMDKRISLPFLNVPVIIIPWKVLVS
jgi:hypothetical protein